MATCPASRRRGVPSSGDGLTGFPEAIETTWPDSLVQTCVVHLIRASMRFVSYGQRKAVAAALRPIYQAPDAETARVELIAFAGSELGEQNPHTVAAFENAWERFTPFLAFPPEVRRVIYTTNMIESLNYQLRKVTKNRGHFPNDAAVVKLLWLAICDIEDKRARERAKERGKPASQRNAPPRLIEGAVTTNWKKALAQLAIAFPDRINPTSEHTQTMPTYTNNLTGSQEARIRAPVTGSHQHNGGMLLRTRIRDTVRAGTPVTTAIRAGPARNCRRT